MKDNLDSNLGHNEYKYDGYQHLSTFFLFQHYTQVPVSLCLEIFMEHSQLTDKIIFLDSNSKGIVTSKIYGQGE